MNTKLSKIKRKYSTFDSLREPQKKGIPQVYHTVSSNGFVVCEGACGTGKTALSLFALLELLDENEFEQIAVVTNVKQQRDIFQDELEQINSIDGNNYTVLTLTGKQDVCPLVQNGDINAGEIQSECERLRDSTRKIVNESGDKSHEKLQTAQNLQEDAELSGNKGDAYTSNGVIEYPFLNSERPQESGRDYCAYYAGHLEAKIGEDIDGGKETIPEKLTNGGVITQFDLLKHGSEWGTCPHSVMGELIEQVDVVIGNYLHLFDDNITSAFTQGLISQDTVCIIDEAHNLVPTTRNILSKDFTLHGLDDALYELESILQLIVPDLEGLKGLGTKGIDIEIGDVVPDNTPDILKERLNTFIRDKNLSMNKYANSWKEFIDYSKDIRGIFKENRLQWRNADSYSDNWTLSYLMRSFELLYKLLERMEKLILKNCSLTDSEDIEISIDDPENSSADKITTWVDFQKKGRSICSSLEEISETTSKVNMELRNNSQSSFSDTGSVISKWVSSSPVSYYKELEIEKSHRKKRGNYITSDELRTNRNVQLHLKNCLPKNEISETLDSLGGGVLMSATLAPLNMFGETAGLKNGAIKDRPICTLQYGLNFPEENRKTVTVESTPFTYSNKSNQKTRDEYKRIIQSTVDTVQGNVLICMPTYTEAEWASDVVRDTTDVQRNNIFIDSSSTNTETTKMKKEFFNADKKSVLVTSAHGTLIEGVDYEGDKLHCTLVCGVPIENTQSNYKSAIQYAYSQEFGDNNGFRYAFTVPAVRKTRQAIGRVIRNNKDKGFRIVADNRYSTNCSGFNCVDDLLTTDYHSESTQSTSEELLDKLEQMNFSDW